MRNRRVTSASEVKWDDTRSRSESEAEQGVQLAGVDAKPSDLHMSRLKSRSHGMEARTAKR